MLPGEGVLVILQPPCPVAAHDLDGFSAELRPATGPTITLDYVYWHVNPQSVIGLLCQELDVSSVPLRAKVVFVARLPRGQRVPAA